MNTQVTETNYIQVIQDLRTLVHQHHHIIIDLEDALIKLRRQTWPYIQSRKEKHALDRIEEKEDFFKYVGEEETRALLVRKSKFRPLNSVYTNDTLNTELRAIKKNVQEQDVL